MCKSYWAEAERLFKTLFCVFVVFAVVVVLPVRAGQDKGVGGLELQTDEDVAKKST